MENMLKITGRDQPEMWSSMFFKGAITWDSHAIRSLVQLSVRKNQIVISPAKYIMITLQVTVCNFEMEMKL